MKNYIEKILHCDVEVKVYDKVDRLPLIMQETYEYHIMKVMDVQCLVVAPKEQMNLRKIKAANEYMERETGLKVVFCFESLNIYTKNKMLEDRIAFILKGEQLYLPFLGTYLKQESREAKAVGTILSLTQKFLLMAIYRNWKKITVSEAARKLSVSRMSMSRVFSELENRDLGLIKYKGKFKYFMWEKGMSLLWDFIQPILKNPIKREYRLERSLQTESLYYGGMTALSEYTMIADNSYKTYAIIQAQVNELDLESKSLVTMGETPGAIICVMSYEIRFEEYKCIDPLSIILTLDETEKEDPRVEKEVEGLLKEVFNGKWNTEI